MLMSSTPYSSLCQESSTPSCVQQSHSLSRNDDCDPTASTEQPIEPDRSRTTCAYSQGKAIESQQCYGGGESMLFNASEVDNRVADVFVNVPTSDIDD
ncbi:hypothetical protein E5676_scaffold1784G00020 [Cucumis melo var. makuwa]|uniref:Uncharacterized protein n=1 Tax=Cucumis melo var. makuwa TaxID=1194695 RepID=A0A5D3DVH8_CUCMM|nr:hypothetical protein E6C27_scaffold471G00020 [Cucumis melo var. makuwa]TYK27295.1 hypothetical protein E5676_scaffold1784G00020 [Cucumis melo var. makuwa]